MGLAPNNPNRLRRVRYPRTLFALALFVAGCTGAGVPNPGTVPAPAGSSSTSNARQARGSIVPLIDYHKHMTGPVALPPAPPLLPTISLPQELAALLREREKSMGQATPGDLFVDDGLILDLSNPTRWVRGRQAVQDMLSRFISATFRFHPNAYAMSDSVGFIAGTVSALRGQEERHVLNFIMGTIKEKDGKWRIGAEGTTIKTPPDNREPYTAEKVIAELEEAGIRRALVLSDAYKIGGGWQRPGRDERAAVRAENDWAAAEAAKFPDRLVAFCSVNPLKDYALEEVARCARIAGVKGIKLHFDDSKVDLLEGDHLEKVRRLFRTANENRMAIAVHLNQRLGRYGPEYSRIFLREVLTAAPAISVQIMHLGGDTGYSTKTDEVLGVFADAITADREKTRNLYFEVSGIVSNGQPDDVSELIVKRLRQIGLDRIVFGSDGLPNPPPAQSWPVFRKKLPLTDDEIRQIAGNIAPYMR